MNIINLVFVKKEERKFNWLPPCHEHPLSSVEVRNFQLDQTKRSIQKCHGGHKVPTCLIGLIDVLAEAVFPTLPILQKLPMFTLLLKG